MYGLVVTDNAHLCGTTFRFCSIRPCLFPSRFMISLLHSRCGKNTSAWRLAHTGAGSFAIRSFVCSFAIRLLQFCAAGFVFALHILSLKKRRQMEREGGEEDHLFFNVALGTRL